MISKLCYELYKVDWKHSHMITAEREMDSIKNYYEFIEEHDYDENLYTYDDYVEEFGYDGELYVCYDEFLETEYINDDYICGLLDNKKLIAIYHIDVREIESIPNTFYFKSNINPLDILYCAKRDGRGYIVCCAENGNGNWFYTMGKMHKCLANKDFVIVE